MLYKLSLDVKGNLDYLWAMKEREHIREILEKGHSKALRNELITYVGNSAKKMKALMHFFFHDNLQYCQRSSWSVGVIGVENHKLVAPYLEQMVKTLDNPKHDAVARNILRIFEDIDLPEDLEGHLCDKCFDYVENPKHAIALRAFGLTVLQKIARSYPELQSELVALVKEIMPMGSAAIKVRCRRVLKEFDN